MENEPKPDQRRAGRTRSKPPCGRGA